MKVPTRDQQARADFAVFLALSFVRTPTMRRMAAEVHAHGLQTMQYAYATNSRAFDGLVKRTEKELGPIDEETREIVRHEFLNPKNYIIEIPQERTLNILKAGDKLAPILFDMNWSLMLAKHGYFITGDNPLVREVDPKTRHPLMGDGGFLNPTAEIIYPLSPKILLLLRRKGGMVNPIASRQFVDAVNRSIAINSERFIYSHVNDKRIKKLSDQFKHNRPGISFSGFGPKETGTVKIGRKPRRSNPVT